MSTEATQYLAAMARKMAHYSIYVGAVLRFGLVAVVPAEYYTYLHYGLEADVSAIKKDFFKSAHSTFALFKKKFK